MPGPGNSKFHIEGINMQEDPAVDSYSPGESRETKILVSRCLTGYPCSHDGKGRLNKKIRRMVDTGAAVPVCPEQLAGLPSPREAAEIEGAGGAAVLDGEGRALARTGKDLSGAFVAGAQKTLQIARQHGCLKAVLKARSPSCGRGQIYDGSFSGRLKGGSGVTAALLMRTGIEVVTDEEI